MITFLACFIDVSGWMPPAPPICGHRYAAVYPARDADMDERRMQRHVQAYA
jgi:hypothetical protein